MKSLNLIFALMFFSLCSFSQEIKPILKNEIAIVAGPTYGSIINQNVSNDKYALNKGGVGVNFGINYCRHFNSFVGVGLGLEYNRITNTVWYKGGGRGDVLINDGITNLHYLVVQSNYYEKVVLNQLDIPITLNIGVPINEHVNFFVNAGMKFNIVVGSRYIKKGTYTLSGAYPVFTDIYNLMENQTSENFTTTEYNVNDEWNVNPVNFSFIINGGFKVKLSEKTNLIIAPGYMHGLNDITSDGSSADYVNIYKEKSPYKPNKMKQFVMKFGISFLL